MTSWHWGVPIGEPWLRIQFPVYKVLGQAWWMEHRLWSFTPIACFTSY